MNPESNQFVAVRDVHTSGANCIDEFRRHSVNLESNELVRVQPLQVLRFDVSGNLQALVMDGHRRLLLAVDPSEAQRLHLVGVLRVSYEMKQPGAFTVMQKPFAFEFSRVSRDRKMNFLPSRLGEIQSRTIGRRPLRTGVKVMPGAGVHQGKLHLPWDVGAPDGPVAALCIAAESLRDAQYDAGDHQD